MLGFMRYGKPLGLLNWKTDHIPLLGVPSEEEKKSAHWQEFEAAVSRGEFIEPEERPKVHWLKRAWKRFKDWMMISW